MHGLYCRETNNTTKKISNFMPSQFLVSTFKFLRPFAVIVYGNVVLLCLLLCSTELQTTYHSWIRRRGETARRIS